jgi:hypothetical protein
VIQGTNCPVAGGSKQAATFTVGSQLAVQLSPAFPDVPETYRYRADAIAATAMTTSTAVIRNAPLIRP